MCCSQTLRAACHRVPQGVSLPPRHMEGVQSSVSSYVVSSNGRSKRGTKRWREYFSCKRSPTSLISFKAWERDHRVSAEKTDARKLSAHLPFCMPTDRSDSKVGFHQAINLQVWKCAGFVFDFCIWKPLDQVSSTGRSTESDPALPDYSNSKART